MNEREARDEICRIGKSLFDRGYVHGTAGNISVRLSDGSGYFITPTDACLGFLNAERLARLDANGQQIAGDRASKTLALHAQIYAAATKFDPAVACVIHTHSTHCVALTLSSCADELLAAITPYFVMKIGHVPIVPYDRPGAPAIATAVADTIRRYGERGTPIRAVMLERLGPNVWHDTPASAMAVLEELEETARLVCTCRTQIEPLDDSQIDQLRQTFGARW
jgi:3-dehydro-4-phosphotetronate decarboxylase